TSDSDRKTPFLGLVRKGCAPAPGRPGAEAEAEAGAGVDCRDLLVTPIDQLDPGPKRLRALLEACRDDPARFQAEVLGRRLWSRRVEVCHAIARSPIPVVPAGRAVGKSFLLAGLALWWLYTRPHSLV